MSTLAPEGSFPEGNILLEGLDGTIDDLKDFLERVAGLLMPDVDMGFVLNSQSETIRKKGNLGDWAKTKGKGQEAIDAALETLRKQISDANRRPTPKPPKS